MTTDPFNGNELDSTADEAAAEMWRWRMLSMSAEVISEKLEDFGIIVDELYLANAGDKGHMQSLRKELVYAFEDIRMCNRDLRRKIDEKNQVYRKSDQRMETPGR